MRTLCRTAHTRKDANVTSLTTANAVLRGLAESKSDGIIQVSTGGGGLCVGVSGQGYGPRCNLHC